MNGDLYHRFTTAGSGCYFVVLIPVYETNGTHNLPGDAIDYFLSMVDPGYKRGMPTVVDVVELRLPRISELHTTVE